MNYTSISVSRVLLCMALTYMGASFAAQAGRVGMSRFSIALDEAQKEAAIKASRTQYLAQFPKEAVVSANIAPPVPTAAPVIPLEVTHLRHENEELKQQIARLNLADATKLLRENETLKREIARLNDLLTQALKNAATGELAPDEATDDLIKKIEAFKADYKTNPNHSVTDILELLDTERKDKIALDVYSFIMETLRTLTVESHYEKVVEDLAKFTDHHYTGKLIEKYENSTKEQLRKASIIAAEESYTTWRNHPQLKEELDDSPALNLIFVEERNLPLIKKEVWPYLTNLLKYSSIEHLNAVMHYLGVKVILKPNPADWISKFFVSLEDHIDRRKDKADQQEGIKFKGHVKNSFVASYKGEITKYFAKDYTLMRATASSYKDIGNQYFIELLNTPEIFEERAKQSPVLYLLSLTTDKLGKIKDDLFDPLRDYIKYASVEDLQAICYKFAQGGYLTESRESPSRFANYIYTEIQNRQKEGQKPIIEMSKQDIKVFAQKYKPKCDAFK